MAGRIQLRRGTAANWTSANPTLAAGEVGVETDTGYAKVGNGSTAWTSLGYVDARAAALLTAHLDDTADAHDASAISVLDTAGNWTATDVEGVLAEVPSRYASRSTTGLVVSAESYYQFLAFGPSSKIYGLDAHSGSRKFAVSTDDMATWTDKSAPNASVNPHACWVLASNAIICAADDKLYRSTDDGATWATVLTFDSGNGTLASALTEHIDGKLYVAAYGPSGKIYTSANDGVTWTLHSTMTAGTPRDYTNPNRIYHWHSVMSTSVGLLALSGDVGAEAGFWLWSGSAWVRQTPVDTDETTSQKWRAVSAQERDGYLYWGQDTNDDVQGGFWKAPLADLSNATKLATVPTSAWYSAITSDDVIVFGSALEGGGGGFQDNYQRVWAIDAIDAVHEIWRGRSTASRTTANTPIYAVKADTSGRIGIASREMAWHNMSTNYRATSYIGTAQRGAGPLQIDQPPRPVYGPRAWLLTATTADPTTTNTTGSADTLPEMDTTIDVRYGVPLLINFTGMFETDANNVRAYAVLEIDGARRSHTLRWTMDSVATVESEIVLSDLFIPPTTNRVRVRVLWFVQSGTGTAIGTDRSMHIVELGR